MSATAVPSAANATLRGGFLAAIFLMATSAIGPGFITQTATFTAKLGAAFAFAILASILIDFVVQLNIWRITALTGKRASETANAAIPGAGYLLAVLVMIGTPLVAPLIGLNNPKSAMAYGGLMGTTSGVAGGLAATDKRLVPYGAMTATFFTGLGCLMGPSVLYLALLAVTG